MPRLLEEGNIEEAEVQKQRIEQLQRERRRVLEENNLEHQPRFFRFVHSCGGRLRGPACPSWMMVHCRQIVSAWPSLSSDRTGAFLVACLASSSPRVSQSIPVAEERDIVRSGPNTQHLPLRLVACVARFYMMTG